MSGWCRHAVFYEFPPTPVGDGFLKCNRCAINPGSSDATTFSKLPRTNDVIECTFRHFSTTTGRGQAAPSRLPVSRPSRVEENKRRQKHFPGFLTMWWMTGAPQGLEPTVAKWHPPGDRRSPAWSRGRCLGGEPRRIGLAAPAPGRPRPSAGPAGGARPNVGLRGRGAALPPLRSHPHGAGSDAAG